MGRIKIQKLPHCYDIPKYSSYYSSGMDLYSAHDYIIEPWKWQLIETGIAIEFPNINSSNSFDANIMYEAQVRSRSGLAAKHGLFVLCSPGTIDFDYRDEIKVPLMNLTDNPYKVKRGDRIAQLVICSVYRFHDEEDIEIVDSVNREIDRGGGFGSTGK